MNMTKGNLKVDERTAAADLMRKNGYSIDRIIRILGHPPVSTSTFGAGGIKRPSHPVDFDQVPFWMVDMNVGAMPESWHSSSTTISGDNEVLRNVKDEADTFSLRTSIR